MLISWNSGGKGPMLVPVPDAVMLPIDFDINVKPYSLITARERALPPSARLLYDIILEESLKQAG